MRSSTFLSKVFVSSVAAALLAAGLAACSSGDGDPTPTGTDDEALRHRGCVDTVLCVQGYVWSNKSCSCVPAKTTSDGGVGVACGTKHCGQGEYCCSSSCGICAPVGAMCPMIACATTN